MADLLVGLTAVLKVVYLDSFSVVMKAGKKVEQWAVKWDYRWVVLLAGCSAGMKAVN